MLQPAGVKLQQSLQPLQHAALLPLLVLTQHQHAFSLLLSAILDKYLKADAILLNERVKCTLQYKGHILKYDNVFIPIDEIS